MSRAAAAPARALALAALGCALAVALAATARAAVVDGFESAAVWKPLPADGVVMKLASEPGIRGNALRVDFEFTKGGGYAVLRRELDLALPANYRFTLAVRGVTGPQNLEFKLVDSTGANVWWSNRRDFVFSDTWQTVTTKKRHISFAWGPIGGGELRRARSMEFAITAGSGGKGTVWLDELTLDPLPPDRAVPPRPVARAFSSERRHPASAAVDGDSLTEWRSGGTPPRPWLIVDLGMDREFGGLAIDWTPAAHASSYDVESTLDHQHWSVVRRVRDGDGGRDWLYLPESEARALRIRSLRPGPVAIREVRVLPLEAASSRTAFFEVIAQGSPRGRYPRAFTGEQAFWAVVGADRADDEALLGEDGALETGAGEFSIEPFLYADGRLVTWADARTTEQQLERGRLPLPVTRWFAAGWELEVHPAVTGAGGTSTAWVRYVVRNPLDVARKVTLFLALRPFQVNPPVQFLNLAGGAARIDSLSGDSTLVRINQRRALVSLAKPSGFGATTFDAGDVTTFLARGKLPLSRVARDPFGAASGALAYELEVPERDQREVVLLVPLGPLSGEAMVRLREVAASPGRPAMANASRAIAGIADNWRGLYDRASVELPDPDLADTFAAQLGWILANRDGAAIQPGSRSYARSWIRDGSLTSSALLRLGHADAAREFLEWFAPYQYADGKVPCCVDRRGSDPVPEHDSHGQLIWLAAKNYRLTNDKAAAQRMWPHVRAAALHLDSLRATRRTAEWRTPRNAPYFGLLPPSISHEGYSAKPMHSYWDDLFALRGFRDAAFLADALGKDDAARFARSRDEFGRDLGASVRAAMKAHAIDFIPGCADLGDFDATSTTIALSPVQAGDVLPREALERTFERYWEFFVKRRDGVEPWDAFTPYEIRNVGAFVRLGWRDRASELLKFFMEHRRPAGWRQWPEVVYREVRSPRFLGDLPHTWVGSDFVRSVLEMLAYERERDDALVIAAGVPESWVAEIGPPVRVRGIVTRWGRLSYTLRRTGEGLELKLEDGLTVPRGGLVVSAPGVGAGWLARLDGRSVPITSSGEVVVRKAAFTLLLTPR